MKNKYSHLKKVASGKKYKVKQIFRALLVIFITGLLSFLIGVSGDITYALILFILLTVIIIYLIISVLITPNDTILYDEKEQSFVIFAFNNLIPFKSIVIPFDKISKIYYRDKSNVTKLSGNYGLYFILNKKIYKVNYLNNISEAYNEVIKICEELVKYYKNIKERNMDRLLEYGDDQFIKALSLIMESEVYDRTLSDNAMDVYFTLDFIHHITINHLHYYILYHKQYLNRIINMFDKIDMGDLKDICLKIFYAYPKTTGIEFYEDIKTIYENPEEFNIFREKIINITDELNQKNKNKEILYALVNDIKKNRQYYTFMDELKEIYQIKQNIKENKNE